MTSAFPFGFSGPTTVYLLLYLLTWVVHFFLAGAVLGGAAYAAISTWRGARGSRELTGDVAGALPLLLGIAITAGVAPLLFVQILYTRAFYTANLLLYVRFLAIVPALLACFYLFYAASTKRAATLSQRKRALIFAIAALLALFVGWSWVELHSISVMPEAWIDLYADGRHSVVSVAQTLRGGVFFALAAPAFAAMAAIVAQFHRRDLATAATLAPVAAGGAIVALACAALYGRSLSAPVIEALSAGSVAVHLAGFALALIACATLWAVAGARKRMTAALRWAIVTSTLMALWCLAVVREAIRAVRLDLASLDAAHEHAFASGGKVVFVLFLIVNGAAIAWCLRVALRARSSGSD